jgi:cytochrome c oxidase subunit 4
MSSDVTTTDSGRPTEPSSDEGHDAHADHHADHDAHAPDDGGHRHKEPTDKQYVIIALLLAVLTAIEIAATEVGPDGALLIVSLLVLMVVKFAFVILFFMHLRFDNKLFSRVFYIGLAFAVVLYSAVLATFHFWTP